MKKYTIVATIIFVCVVLAGCGFSNVTIPPLPTNTPVPVVTTAPTPTPTPVIEAAGLENRIVIRIEDVDIVENDPEYDSIPILNFRYQTPYVSIENNDSSAETINSALKDLNSKYITVDGDVSINMDKYNEMLSLATDSYSDSMEEFKFFRKAEILRADDNIIAIKFTNTTFQLGNESVEEEYHYFDTSTGVELSEELITEEAYPKADKNETGTLSIIDAVNDKYELIDLVEVDTEGKDYIIACDGIIYDLYVGDDWYCNILNNNAVQIKATLDDNSTGLFISYISGGEQYTYLIINDPETGNAKLVDSNEVLG